MIIQCQNVQKYHGAQLVLNSITFDIRQGEKSVSSAAMVVVKLRFSIYLMAKSAPIKGKSPFAKVV